MITVVTDSSAYIKKDEAEALGIRLVPMTYTVNGWNYSESYGDKNGNFEILLKSGGEFQTSQPNMAAFLSCFNEELAKGNEVLCITISSRLSGAFATAFAAAKQTENSAVVVFDSHFTAGGLYLLAKEAVLWIQQGEKLPALLQKLSAIRDKISISFSVNDMAPLRHSGRVGFVRAGVGTILNIKPILLCQDGAVVYDCSARGTTDLIKKLLQKVPSDAKEVVINYVGENRAATELYHALEASRSDIIIRVQKVGPVLCINLGLHAIAVSILRTYP